MPIFANIIVKQTNFDVFNNKTGVCLTVSTSIRESELCFQNQWLVMEIVSSTLIMNITIA